MKLLYSTTSPFARKVRVVAVELGVQLEEVPVATLPTKPDPILAAQNPLSKIPTLVRDDGSVLYDSRVICEWLDAEAGNKLVAASGPARWDTLRRQALADGIADAAVLVRYETVFRPEDKRWDDWTRGQLGKIKAGLDALEADAKNVGQSFDLGHISAVCALGYLEFRNIVSDPLKNRPRLAAFLASALSRPSVARTMLA
jgi:glutathione S-transferase